MFCKVLFGQKLKEQSVFGPPPPPSPRKLINHIFCITESVQDFWQAERKRTTHF